MLPYEQGIWAAFESITPICPYSRIYEFRNYRDWMNGFVDGKLFVKIS